MYRFGLPLLANGAAVLLLVRSALEPRQASFAGTMAVLGAASLLTWYCGGLRTVHQEGDSIVISARAGEVRISAALIDRVGQCWWARPGVVTIHFRESTPAGRTVSFIAEASILSFVGLGWLDDQMVTHVRRLAKRARARVPVAPGVTVR